MTNFFLSLIGKTVAQITRLKGGHGSALPGLVVEKISPKFLARNLEKLPLGVIVVSGTNGKTTTTKILTEILRDQNIKVFTNPSGSNFTRGVASELIRQMRRGKINAEVAVLELDEAHAVHFVQQIQPRMALILNVFRDQLDRFGEIDKTANLLKKVALATRETAIFNSCDPEIRKIAEEILTKKTTTKKPRYVKFFGFNNNLKKFFPSDQDWHNQNLKRKTEPKKSTKNLVELEEISKNIAKYKIDEEIFSAKLNLSGAHNFLNSAAALAAAKEILSDKFDLQKAKISLEKIQPAFGRGENFVLANSKIKKISDKFERKKTAKNKKVRSINQVEKSNNNFAFCISDNKKAPERTASSNTSLKLILVKNPSGFQSSLNEAEKIPTLIAINDRYADGCDVSWLYDVDFTALQDNKAVFTSGIRGSDMALRLLYSDIYTQKNTDSNDNFSKQSRQNDLEIIFSNKKNLLFLKKLLHKKREKKYDKNLQSDLLKFLKFPGDKKQIFATYTAMLKIREILKKMEAPNE